MNPCTVCYKENSECQCGTAVCPSCGRSRIAYPKDGKLYPLCPCQQPPVYRPQFEFAKSPWKEYEESFADGAIKFTDPLHPQDVVTGITIEGTSTKTVCEDGEEAPATSGCVTVRKANGRPITDFSEVEWGLDHPREGTEIEMVPATRMAELREKETRLALVLEKQQKLETTTLPGLRSECEQGHVAQTWLRHDLNAVRKENCHLQENLRKEREHSKCLDSQITELTQDNNKLREDLSFARRENRLLRDTLNRVAGEFDSFRRETAQQLATDTVKSYRPGPTICVQSQDDLDD